MALSFACLPGPGRVPCLCQLGRLAERPLHLRTVSLAVLLSGAFWRLPPRLVRPEAFLVSRLSAVLPRAADSVDPWSVPFHLLLLPRSLLQSLLGRPPRLRGRRAPESYLGERRFPLILQNLHRIFLRLSYPVWLCLVYDAVDCLVVGWPLRHRARHDYPGGQRRPARRLHFRLPCVPSSRGRNDGPPLRRPIRKKALRLRQLPQRQAQEVGLGEPVFGGIRRSLCSSLLDGHLVRLENCSRC